jgi:ATP:ADP antiporter, AAA family
VTALLRRVVDVRPAELRALLWSFASFFFLLAGYYILRSIRDERGVAAGASALPWLFRGTFVVMLVVVPLWSALIARLPRARLLPFVYRFFAINLVVFFLLFRGGSSAAGQVFFIWVTVFNLIAVAAFWSLMADIFKQEQAKRLFGFIIAGGSAGGILGPLLTSVLVGRIGPASLLLVSAAFLEIAVQCIGVLLRWRHQQPDVGAAEEAPVGGGIFTGMKVVFSSPYLLGIAGYIILGTFAATFTYILQAKLVGETAMTVAERTALFARMDLVANLLTMVLQAFVTGRLLTRLGVTFVLALVAPICSVGFGLLAARPVMAVATGLRVAQRSLAYGLSQPALNVLYTVVDREQKYKSKAFIETIVYRGGDMLGASAVDALLRTGLGPAMAAITAIPLGVAWLLVALFVGRRHRQLAGDR